MTVAQLRLALETADPDAIVTCSPGGGVLSAVTATANGFVILDAVPAVLLPPGSPGPPRHV